MIIRIHSTKNTAAGNKGSSADLVNYLTKEDLEKEPLEREGSLTTPEITSPQQRRRKL